MTNWQAVANHLATEIIGWHKSGEAYIDKYNCYKRFVKNWQPHKNWQHTGAVIDKMKKRNLYLALFYDGTDNDFTAYFYKSGYRLEDETEHVQESTERRAIALAAALATGYTEKERTEAEVLLDKLFKEGLYCMKDTRERILELFEQSFERVRKEKAQKQSKIIEDLRQIDKEGNDAGRLLTRIRYRLLDKIDLFHSSLTATEKIILASIEKWMKEL